jgi:hypothetical protein
VSAVVPICQTRRPSAKTLRYGAELAEKQKRALELAARKDIDLTGLGQVLLPNNNLSRVSNRRDRPERTARARAEGASGLSARRLCCEFGHRGNRVGPTRANPLRQVPHQKCGLRAG